MNWAERTNKGFANRTPGGLADVMMMVQYFSGENAYSGVGVDGNRITWAVTLGRDVFLADANSEHADRHLAATLIHEAFHVLFETTPGNFIGMGLSDQELARAAGVYQDAWDTVDDTDGSQRRNLSSEAFTKALRRDCGD